MFRSQKARGLALAAKLASKSQELALSSPNYIVVSAASTSLSEAQAVRAFVASVALKGEIMLRPAPTSPRHGFVDSRPVSRGDFKHVFPAVMKEVVAADPEGELILMPFLPATHNFVISSAGVVIGRSFDGATAGKNAVFVPCVSPLREYLQAVSPKVDLAEAYGIGVDDDAYIEAVAAGPRVYITQVRAGPLLAATQDYVPGDVTITEVVTPDTDDLLAWEARAVELKSSPGVVVYHAGGAVSSHFGVHCAINGVPYVTSAEPKVGDELKATAAEAWGQDDFEAVAGLLGEYANLKITSRSDVVEAIGFCIAVLHALPGLISSRTTSAHRVVAFALAFFPKLLTTLACGEARHAHNHITSSVWTKARNVLPHVSREQGRETVYENTLAMHLNLMPDLLARAHTIMDSPRWNTNGYGGAKWAQCTDATVTFLDAVMGLHESPSEETWSAAVSAFNVAINQAHNNGWWLNKYVQKPLFDTLAKTPVFGLVKPLLWRVLEPQEPTTELALVCTRGLAEEYALSLAAVVAANEQKEVVNDSDDDDYVSDDDDDDTSDTDSDSDDDDDDGTSTPQEFSHQKIADVQPYGDIIGLGEGLDVMVTHQGHFQVPGVFKNQNRPWGVSVDLEPGYNPTAQAFAKVIYEAYKGAAKVGSLNETTTQYMRMRLKLEDDRLYVNLFSSSVFMGVSVADHGVLGVDVDWAEVKHLHPLATLYGAL